MWLRFALWTKAGRRFLPLKVFARNNEHQKPTNTKQLFAYKTDEKWFEAN